MNDTKYIVYDRRGIEMMLIFSNLEKHDDVANGIPMEHKLISAGFINMYITEEAIGQTIAVNCHGKSVSLDLESRPDRDAVLAKWILGKGDYRGS